MDKNTEISTLLAHVADESPSEFKTALDAILAQRILDKLADEKQNVAQNYFASDEEETDSTEETDETDPELDDSELEYEEEENGEDTQTA